ncbi:hypothetical protein BGZ74_005378, partial [Mortierella antarctica]
PRVQDHQAFCCREGCPRDLEEHVQPAAQALRGYLQAVHPPRKLCPRSGLQVPARWVECRPDQAL